MSALFHTAEVAHEVIGERVKQDRKWGSQDHPDRSPLEPTRLETYAGRAGYWKAHNDIRVQRGDIAWDGILLEEVYEALENDDPALLRTELIQVAAVAVAWAEAIDRRS